MEPRAHHVLIGLFVVLGISAALAFTLWLARPSGGEVTDKYIVVFDESVTGLTVGSNVRYTGIPVGRVTRLRLDPQDPRKVRAYIEVGPSTPIKADTDAQLRMAGITGSAEIQLSGGSPDSPLLTARGDQLPVIHAEPSALARLTGGGEQLVDHLLTLFDRADKLLSIENIRKVSTTLDNVEHISGVVAERSDEIEQAVENLKATTANSRRVTDQTAQLVERANAMLDERGEPLLDSATRAVTSLERTSTRLERLLRKNEDALDSGMQGLRSVDPALQELRAVLSSLREITRRLEDDPGEYLFGGDDVPEFQP